MWIYIFNDSIYYNHQPIYTKTMKKSNIYKGFLDSESEFDHHHACWANNHRGWAKMKKSNKKTAKKRERNNWKKEAKEYER